ncbi:hypothetical protein COU37_01070 [Candidatus Micrarchaeota archaeon CG10_big_fil_rev_8_21_14_0_10_45_29]|nr:MAG: hypothetical protein COU37_01070 [Candidatus Micrarchaeota archaeon CG10_big_fil_rev_8_21_14_0_10_45_29]
MAKLIEQSTFFPDKNKLMQNFNSSFEKLLPFPQRTLMAQSAIEQIRQSLSKENFKKYENVCKIVGRLAEHAEYLSNIDYDKISFERKKDILSKVDVCIDGICLKLAEIAQIELPTYKHLFNEGEKKSDTPVLLSEYKANADFITEPMSKREIMDDMSDSYSPRNLARRLPSLKKKYLSLLTIHGEIAKIEQKLKPLRANEEKEFLDKYDRDCGLPARDLRKELVRLLEKVEESCGEAIGSRYAYPSQAANSIYPSQGVALENFENLMKEEIPTLSPKTDFGKNALNKLKEKMGENFEKFEGICNAAARLAEHVQYISQQDLANFGLHQKALWLTKATLAIMGLYPRMFERAGLSEPSIANDHVYLFFGEEPYLKLLTPMHYRTLIHLIQDEGYEYSEKSVPQLEEELCEIERKYLHLLPLHALLQDISLSLEPLTRNIHTNRMQFMANASSHNDFANLSKFWDLVEELNFQSKKQGYINQLPDGIFYAANYLKVKDRYSI